MPLDGQKKLHLVKHNIFRLYLLYWVETPNLNVMANC